MSECTYNPDQGRYLLLAFEHAADLQAEVNRLMSLQIRPSWRLHGPTFFANAGYRQAMVRDTDSRDWLLPHQSPPVCHQH